MNENVFLLGKYLLFRGKGTLRLQILFKQLKHITNMRERRNDKTNADMLTNSELDEVYVGLCMIHTTLLSGWNYFQIKKIFKRRVLCSSALASVSICNKRITHVCSQGAFLFKNCSIQLLELQPQGAQGCWLFCARLQAAHTKWHPLPGTGTSCLHWKITRPLPTTFPRPARLPTRHSWLVPRPDHMVPDDTGRRG